MTDIKPDVTITDLPDASPSDPLEALSWLGETVEEVAEGLRARGIKGQPKNPASCPIANYLSVWYDGNVSVGPCRFNATRDGDRNVPRHDVPPTVKAFVWEFDTYQFPDLIDNSNG